MVNTAASQLLAPDTSSLEVLGLHSRVVKLLNVSLRFSGYDVAHYEGSEEPWSTSSAIRPVGSGSARRVRQAPMGTPCGFSECVADCI